MKSKNVALNGKTLTTISLADETSFFARGKSIATLLDAKQPIKAETTLSYEDPSDMLRVFTAARLDLFQAVKAQPDSISGIAVRLQRDRSAVKRDVDCLAMAGLIQIEDQVLAGHGRMKWISPAAQSVRLEAVL
jgi:predicted transcriptional regulator